MNFFSILTLLGGLAMFLYGMQVMGDGLAKVSGGKLEQILENLTSSKWKAVLLGMCVTAVIQSSSATTVMVVGFVNSGIMKLTQAVGIIMGANIGTTITSWILSLTGIESSNFFISLLKPSSFSPILAMVGIILLTFTKSSRKKDIGTIMLGFAVLMFGMESMSGAVKPLADVPEFTGLLLKFSNPVAGILAGTILTAIIQSSSASVGILQALCMTGAVPFSSAFPIIMGQNIGTCVTALLSAIGANKNAKRAAMIHLYFNLIGTVVFMILFYMINAAVHFPFMTQMATPATIAITHSVFNITATLVWLPFSNLLVKLACLTICDDKKDEVSKEDQEFMILESRFLEKPAFAVEQGRNAARHMERDSRKALDISLGLLRNYEEEQAERVQPILEKENTGLSVAFFAVSSDGTITVRKPNDYVSSMIELAGGNYSLNGYLPEEDNALSTMKMQMEDFYAAEKDADILIYNGTIEGELTSIDELVQKNSLFADFKAVKTGQVYTTGSNFYQQTSGTCDFIEDLNKVLNGETDAEYRFLKKIN